MSYDPEYHRRYRELHRERIHEKKRQEYLSNKETVKARSRDWAVKNKDRKLATAADYRERKREQRLVYMKERYQRNPQRHISAMSAWRKANPELYREQYLRATFGISLSAYNALLVQQGGVCAICKTTPKTVLAVDHDHDSGEVRGLLCSSCNTGLGHFNDDSRRMRCAVEYLEAAIKHKEIAV